MPFALPCCEELTENLLQIQNYLEHTQYFCKAKGFSLTLSKMDKIIESCTGPVKSEINMKLCGDVLRIMLEKMRTLRRLILATTSSS